MKKMVPAAIAVLFIMSVISCKSVSPKRKACEDACTANKTACYDRIRDKKGDMDTKKKTKCDVDTKACSNDCARKYK